jgi:hypothetical protein
MPTRYALWRSTGRRTIRLRGGDWSDLAASSGIFETLARYHGGEVGVQLHNRAEWAWAYWVSPTFFQVFDAAPVRGRSFTEADRERGGGGQRRICAPRIWGCGGGHRRGGSDRHSRLRSSRGDAIQTTTLETMISDSVAMPRFRTFLVTTFAVVALLLAMAGVYGVMAYPVSQRTGELGLRMTLGCAPGGVVRLVPARALAVAGAGLVAGVGLSFAGGRLMTTLLFGVRPGDLGGCTAAALAIVGRRASTPRWRRAGSRAAEFDFGHAGR